MKISDVTIKTFRTHADRWDAGHGVPIPHAELMQTVLTIVAGKTTSINVRCQTVVGSAMLDDIWLTALPVGPVIGPEQS